jgi:hypothetical protein
VSGSDRMIESVLYFSNALREKGHLFLLRHLRDWGATFFYPGTDDTSYDVDAFCAENPDERRFRFGLGSHFYNLSFMRQSPNLLLTSSASFTSPAKNREAVSTILPVLEKVLSLLSFQYGFLDVYTDIPDDKTITSLKLPFIFWMNFFGASYISIYGKDFLLGAPGFRTSELSDGTIEYVVSNDLFEPSDGSLDDAIVKYFAQKVKTKRHVPVPDRW